MRYPNHENYGFLPTGEFYKYVEDEVVKEMSEMRAQLDEMATEGHLPKILKIEPTGTLDKNRILLERINGYIMGQFPRKEQEFKYSVDLAKKNGRVMYGISFSWVVPL